jgi:hypothetical protein
MWELLPDYPIRIQEGIYDYLSAGEEVNKKTRPPDVRDTNHVRRPRCSGARLYDHLNVFVDTEMVSSCVPRDMIVIALQTRNANYRVALAPADSQEKIFLE